MTTPTTAASPDWTASASAVTAPDASDPWPVLAVRLPTDAEAYGARQSTMANDTIWTEPDLDELRRDFGEIENLQVSRKGPGDFVTNADERTERILREELKKARPAYGMLAEEGGATKGSDPDHRWLVDPIDGTTNFIHGVPFIAVSIALERTGLTGGRLAYPSDAPALAPGAAYTLELYSGQTRVDATRFEIADRPRADGVRRDLQDIDQALGPDVPPSSRAVVQAGYLASRGFLHDARAVVVTALASDSDQPSLHALLGDLYARTGLQREADEAHDQARLLTADPPRR